MIDGRPLREAADIAIAAIAAELEAHDRPDRMITTEAFEAFKARAPR
jgi:hypothetical protein